MLKVEVQKGIVTVASRSPTNPSFILIAFLMALAFHFIGLIFFHIAPLNLLGVNAPPSAPAMVTSEWREEIVSSLEEPTKLPLLSPPPKRPIFDAKIPSPLAGRMLNLPWETWFEKEFTAHLDQTFIKELSTVASGIEIFIFGDLADRMFEWNHPPSSIPETLVSFPAVAKFEIEVNETTGEIFRRRFLEGDPALEKLAVSWLDNVKFSPKPHRFSTRGEIQWVIGPP